MMQQSILLDHLASAAEARREARPQARVRVMLHSGDRLLGAICAVYPDGFKLQGGNVGWTGQGTYFVPLSAVGAVVFEDEPAEAVEDHDASAAD